MLVVYVVEENEAYWSWFEQHYLDLTLKNQTFNIGISRQNKLSEIDWETIEHYVEQIFSRKHLLYEFPNEINSRVCTLYFSGRFEEALPGLKELSKSHNDCNIWTAISVCEYQLLHYQQALIAINRALEIDNNYIVLLNKAAILTEQGLANNDPTKVEQALGLYKAIVEDGIVSDTVFYNYANALSKFAKYDLAVEYFEASVSINPNNAEVWSNYGNVCGYVGNVDLAISCFDKALTLDPNLPEALFSKGSLLFKEYRLADEALKLMLQSAELSSRYELDFPYFFYWISEAFLFKGDYKNAQEWNRRGLNIFSTNNYLLEQKKRIERCPSRHEF